VVQLAPFSCIPEIGAKSLVPQLSKEYGIPVLTLFIDEQTGAAGVQTRLEAFVDLMEQRRSRDLGLGA
jgi:predicted nucleotide-binding protein (sugar kinase/HSP70/actin superfamily)